MKRHSVVRCRLLGKWSSDFLSSAAPLQGSGSMLERGWTRRELGLRR